MDRIEREQNLDMTEVRNIAGEFIDNVGKVVVGKKDMIELVLTALLSGGHALVEDVPGVGKTILAGAVSRSTGCSFKRLQCTPDLLPSDVTGIHFYNQKTSQFELRLGPVMSNILLVDEINRATPRTQSCLLECMQERQVTVDLETIALPRPFFIIATQNPVELQGTFPLPEAQLDRFLLKIKIGYPSFDEEAAILQRFQEDNPLDHLESIVRADRLIELQKICRKVYVDDSIRSYIVAITGATRNHPEIDLGASPRASLGLYTTAQSLAAIRGRNYVTPDDVKYLAAAVLGHRMMIKTEAQLRGKSAQMLIGEILSNVPVPVE